MDLDRVSWTGARQKGTRKVSFLYRRGGRAVGFRLNLEPCVEQTWPAVRSERNPRGAVVKRIVLPALVAGLMIATPGCSIRRMAVNRLGDAMAGSGEVFASDDDPELIKAAAPFSLKLMEALLQESPRHQGLLFATSSGFTQYTYAFVQQDADEMADKDVAAAAALRSRARRLYLRARNYGLRGLEVNHKGFRQALSRDPQAAVRMTRVKDVRLLYWTSVSWAAAIADSKDQPDLIADQPKVEAMIDRALVLDESFDHGAIHSFLISYEMSRRGGVGSPAERARRHFERAVQLSGGQLAGPYVAMAESVAVQQQNLAEFKSLLNQALAIDPDAKPEWRLANLIMQQRARWLLSRTDDLFLTPNSQSQ
jgi:predicted anti-sigma-YlaC factor YlaD